MSELGDFHIPHAEKIEWMIEQDGFAVEPVPADPSQTPPLAGYTYTIGFPDRFEFPDVVVFGLTPVAARGLIGVVAGVLADGVDIPLGDEVLGLLDNELRARFAPVDLSRYGYLFGTAVSWYRTETIDMVQLQYPDRNGFMPYETGFDQRLRHAQPIISRDEP